jgi:putative ABC transport system substrate-binding protein
VRLPVDVIVTRGTPAALAAKQATATIPVVMAAIGEPLGVGVVASLAHPGGNVTGFSAFVTELSGKRVEVMKEAFPAVTRAGFLNNMSNPVAPPQWEATQVAARALGVAVELLDVRAREDIPRAFAAAADGKLGALLTGVEAVTQAHAPLIIEEVARLRIPAIYASREFVDAGGLMTYSVSYPHLYRRAAGLVDKIFKGARAGDLPVEQPTKVDLVINLKTAKALGLDVPATLLARADEVIE